MPHKGLPLFVEAVEWLRVGAPAGDGDGLWRGPARRLRISP